MNTRRPPADAPYEERGHDCHLCGLNPAAMLDLLAHHGYRDEADAAHLLRVVIARTGMTQRELRPKICWAQASISKGQHFPRAVPAVPRHIAGGVLPARDAPVSELELWCAYRAAALGWVPNFQHRIHWGASRVKCDVVLAPPGGWHTANDAAYAIEVRRNIASYDQLAEAIERVTDDYATPLGCVPVIVAYEMAPSLASNLVISPWELESVIGRAGPPYQLEIQRPPRRRRPPRRAA